MRNTGHVWDQVFRPKYQHNNCLENNSQAGIHRPQRSIWRIDEQETIGGERHDHEKETQVAGPIGSGFSLHSGRGCGLAVVGKENACPGPYAGPHDDGLEQPAHGLYLTILNVAGVQAPGRTAVPPSVDAAELGIVAGEGRSIAAGGGGSA